MQVRTNTYTLYMYTDTTCKKTSLQYKNNVNVDTIFYILDHVRPSNVVRQFTDSYI